MQNTPEKNYSVVVNLSDIAEANGELANLTDESDRKQFITNFFVEKYGGGSGKLNVAQKNTKVRLTWVPAKIDDAAENLHKAALELVKSKNYTDAINNWVKAIAINSSDPDYFFHLAVAFFEIKNYKESKENLQSALGVCPIYYKAHLVLGSVLLKERKYDEAEKHLKETISLNPRIAFTYLNLGAIYSILKKYDEGIAMFSRSLELAPGEVRALFGLGKIHSIRGEFDQANQYFNKVIESDPTGHLANHAKRAMASAFFEEEGSYQGTTGAKNVEQLYQDGYRAYLFTDYEASVRLYREYLRSKKDDDFVWFSLGEAYLRTGDISTAIDCYQNAIGLNASKGLYFKELAIAYNYLDRESDVINCLNKAKSLGKNDSLTDTLWGKILIKQQKHDKAIASLEQALKKNSNNLLAKFYLAVAYRKVDQTNAAIDYLEDIVLSPINSPLKMEAESMLERIK